MPSSEHECFVIALQLLTEKEVGELSSDMFVNKDLRKVLQTKDNFLFDKEGNPDPLALTISVSINDSCVDKVVVDEVESIYACSADTAVSHSGDSLFPKTELGRSWLVAVYEEKRPPDNTKNYKIDIGSADEDRDQSKRKEVEASFDFIYVDDVSLPEGWRKLDTDYVSADVDGKNAIFRVKRPVPVTAKSTCKCEQNGVFTKPVAHS